ncbi:MAG: hypothetical protein PW843_28385 [Azospirillaceae bacterium]|nr:hypothetical protein [Azospirillaceae bacterium]
MIYTDRPYAPKLAAREADIYWRLSNDLNLFALGHSPHMEILAGAPIIENYAIFERPSISLRGIVTDHPRLGNGPVITSQVLLFNIPDGWIRTRSRYYRLGQPHEMFDRDAGSTLLPTR